MVWKLHNLPDHIMVLNCGVVGKIRRSLMAEVKAEWFFLNCGASLLCVWSLRAEILPLVAWETNVSICALSTLWCGLQHSKWPLALMCPQGVRLCSEPSLWPAIAPTRYLSSLWNVTCLPSLPMCQITCHLAIRPTLNVLPWCSVPNEKSPCAFPVHESHWEHRLVVLYIYIPTNLMMFSCLCIHRSLLKHFYWNKRMFVKMVLDCWVKGNMLEKSRCDSLGCWVSLSNSGHPITGKIRRVWTGCRGRSPECCLD